MAPLRSQGTADSKLGAVAQLYCLLNTWTFFYRIAQSRLDCPLASDRVISAGAKQVALGVYVVEEPLVVVTAQASE